MTATDSALAPLRPVRLGTRAMDVERRDGNVYLRLREPLEPYPVQATARLLRWAETVPTRVFLAQQNADGEWDELTYAATLRRVRSLGQWLLDAGLSAERPLMLLSENEFGHALLGLAALHVGIPFVPVSPAYSQLADLQRLRYLIGLIGPGAVYAIDGAADGDRYARAFAEFPPDTKRLTAADLPALFDTAPTSAVDAAHAAITGATLGKVMFTSGSTGQPKGVLFPHDMLSSNYQQVAQAMAFLQDTPPVLVEWLPWHHTFGGTHNLGIALYNGGTFYIDPGRPTPEGIGPTVELLRRVAPTLYFNTPLGFQALLPYLREDRALRENFFSRLELLFYGAARLPEHLWAALDDLSVQTLGQRVLITSGIGSTEAGPSPNFTPWDPGRKPTVGAPVVGVTIKIAPVNDKLEMRFKGSCVTPGYWRDPERTAAAFDEEGYFKTGDAIVFIDPAQPELGLRFDGRIADNFKLASGTWVDVTALRGELIAAGAPHLRDAVITGHDREFLGALLFPDYDAARTLDPALPVDASPQAIVASPAVRDFFQTVLDRLAAANTASSRRILRATLESEPPQPGGELSDKNAISQRAVIERRAATIEKLHAPAAAGDLLVVSAPVNR
jgi:feruloyl-CoA synthase